MKQFDIRHPTDVCECSSETGIWPQVFKAFMVLSCPGSTVSRCLGISTRNRSIPSWPTQGALMAMAEELSPNKSTSAAEARLADALVLAGGRRIQVLEEPPPILYFLLCAKPCMEKWAPLAFAPFFV